MKVAFASRDGQQIDEHFGQATSFHIWEIEPERAQCLEKIETRLLRGDNEDQIIAKATALEGCVIACSTQIGGPAAAKLVARHIHPMKTNQIMPIKDMISQLQEVLRGDMPPWLAKAMGVVPKRTLQLSSDD
jgi:nitrogen fixation protein NifX